MSKENTDVMTVHRPKQPIKKVEIPLNKFNDVAIPHHVNLLKRHKNNIEKFRQMGYWDKMRREQINATRLIKQLKALLYEMDMLRNQVQDSDLIKFDNLTDNARKNAQDAIKEYLVLNTEDQRTLWCPREDSTHIENVSSELEEDKQEIPEMQVQLSSSSSTEEISKQEECIKAWENLQTEVQDVHQLFEEFALVVKEQREKVNDAENNVEVAAENIREGTNNLVRAARYKATMYPIAGAVLGGCLGGPVGLIAGMKLGGLAAIGCGVIGFTGGQFLKRKQQSMEDRSDVELVDVNESSNLKGSMSSPEIRDTTTDKSRNSFITKTKYS